MTPTPAPSATLKPYLPRLAIDWLATRPEDRWQALEGSVVFVDISGFTKMSERLAKRGKVGAEEVTDNLGSVFTRMLSVAYGEGGGLLKFGGDALLLWFGGEQHPERAVRSAHGMRAMLRQVGILDTSAGRVVLRMSVGVHSGTFHFFLVGGGSHREFMVTGPAASRTVDMEGTATAGEILLSPECAAHLPPNLLGKEKGPGVLLRSSPGGMHIVPRDGAEDATVDLRQAVPLAVREHVLHGAAEPEH
ncbi:MAG: adenylate/guanylate cyclase domain-containing protein, partial [Actinomycetota bacterium]